MAEPPEDLDIIVTGFEVDRQQAEAGLMRVFGLDAQRARSFLEQLPVVAKRCRELDAAERYAHALRSIGARIELRPVAAGAEPPRASARSSSDVAPAPRAASSDRAPALRGHASLPPPDSRRLEGPRDEPARHTSASERALARFRAAEKLENPASSNAPPGSIDLYNPVIPRAPALPRDLRQPPSAPRSANPERPDWMISDPLELTPGSDGDTPTSLRPPESESLRQGSRSSVRATRPAGEPSSSRPPRGERLSDRPRSVGLAHAATASVRPGLSAVPRDDGDPRSGRRRRLLRLTAVLAGAALAAVAVLRWSGRLLTEDERRVRAWHQEGIEAGEHAPIRPWLSAAGHSLRGLDGPAADRLLDQLERAGATSVFAAAITGDASQQVAGALVVEMPVDRVARRTILWHLAAARGEQDAPLSDDGQRFELLELR